MLDEARALLGRPGAFADDDVAVFREVLKDQHEERLASSAARQACAVPLATAHACIEALGIAERALLLVDPALRCDVEAAVLLLVACVDAVLLNVDADLQGLDDAQARARVQVRAERLAMAVERHRQRSV